MKLKPWIIFSVLAVFLFVGYRAYQKKLELDRLKAQSPVPLVFVEKVKKELSIKKVDFIGQVQAIQKSDIKAQVTGYLENVAFKEGSTVEEGDLLFEIEDDKYLAVLEQKIAELQQAEAERERAIKSYERYEKLLEEEFASVARVDREKALMLDAIGEVDRAQANLDLAKIDVGYTQIRSPFKGRVSTAKLTKGNYVSSLETLATLVQMDPIRVKFNLTDKSLLGLINNNMEKSSTRDELIPLKKLIVKLVLANGEKVEYEGVKFFIDNQIDAQTGTINAYFDVPNSDNLLVVGNFVTIEMEQEDGEKIMIPSSSIFDVENGKAVYVVGAENIVEERIVELGNISGLKKEVVKGLTEGDTVVVEGIQKAIPGKPVEPKMTKKQNHDKKELQKN